MASLRKTMSRMGEEQLVGVLGVDTAKLIQQLELSSLRPSALADLVLDRYGAEGVLFSPKIRKELLSSLKQDEAEKLCLHLGKNAENPWETLNNTSFSLGSQNAQVLSDFFDIEITEDDDAKVNLAKEVNEIEANYPLFQHQRIAYRKTNHLLNSESRKALLHMPTGAGKTRTAMNIISEFLRESEDNVVIWLAYSEELCSQAAEEFEKAWRVLGDRSVNVFRHYGPYRVSLDDISSGVLVTGLSLMYKTAFGGESFFELGKRTGLVVIDEAHMAIAETYQHVLDLLAPNKNTALLGLTATPGRTWLDPGEDVKLANFFDRRKVSLEVEGYDNPVQYLQDEGYLSKVNSEPLYYNGSGSSLSDAEVLKVSAGLDFPEKLLKSVSEDEQRNLLIVHRIAEEAKSGEKIIIFACSVEHAETLATILQLMELKTKAITSKTAAHERRQSIKLFKETDEVQILTNYGVLTTGFDAPKASVAVVARPTQSIVLYSQMVGRVARGEIAGGTPECKVITVVDQYLGFRDMGEAFTFWDDLWD